MSKKIKRQNTKQKIKRQLENLHYYIARLEKLIVPGKIAEWLYTKNKGLSGRKPFDVILSKNTSQLDRLIHELESGNSG